MRLIFALTLGVILLAWVGFVIYVALHRDPYAKRGDRILRALFLAPRNCYYGQVRNFWDPQKDPLRFLAVRVLSAWKLRRLALLVSRGMDLIRPLIIYDERGKYFYPSGVGAWSFWLSVEEWSGVPPERIRHGTFEGCIEYRVATRAGERQSWRHLLPFAFYELRSGKHEPVWPWDRLVKIHREAAVAHKRQMAPRKAS